MSALQINHTDATKAKLFVEYGRVSTRKATPKQTTTYSPWITMEACQTPEHSPMVSIFSPQCSWSCTSKTARCAYFSKPFLTLAIFSVGPQAKEKALAKPQGQTVGTPEVSAKGKQPQPTLHWLKIDRSLRPEGLHFEDEVQRGSTKDKM